MMPEAPEVIGGARVVLYSPIDQRHRPTGGCPHTVAEVLQGPAAGLAICRYDGEDVCYLFGCDGGWNAVTDTWHQTPRDAMRQAESEYEGVWRTWLSHGPAWEPTGEEEERAIWDMFLERFDFRPSVNPRRWPGIREPRPSVTYDVSHALAGGEVAPALADLNMEAFTLFKACLQPGRRLLALDWQHPCYRFDPFGRFEFSETYHRMIPVLPDGDYFIFLADDFSFGTFGHPWEQTICVLGQRLIDVVERERPRLLVHVVRRNGSVA